MERFWREYDPEYVKERAQQRIKMVEEDPNYSETYKKAAREVADTILNDTWIKGEEKNHEPRV